MNVITILGLFCSHEFSLIYLPRQFIIDKRIMFFCDQCKHEASSEATLKYHQDTEYRASAKGALAKGTFLLRGPIHRTRFSTGPIHCTCIFDLKKMICFFYSFFLD